MFFDKVVLTLQAGRGGDGIVAWRRARYIPKGGPVGGDGGDGGSLYLETDTNLDSLDDYRNRRILRAQSGKCGGGNDCRGKDGEDITFKVPCGTLVRDVESGEILLDLTLPNERHEICRGGKGGRGNAAFKSATHRAPSMFTTGEEGEIKEVELELKLIADVGLVGFPNAGKSTLFGSLTPASPKIAAYPFTTLHPNISQLDCTPDLRLRLADIPGIIEGASENRGLGHAFLRHIERTRLLLFLIDISGFEGRDPIQDFETLRSEIAAYDPALLEKPFLVLLNKCDYEEAPAQIERFKAYYPFSPETLFVVSAKEKLHLEAVVKALAEHFSSVTSQ